MQLACIFLFINGYYFQTSLKKTCFSQVVAIGQENIYKSS